MSPCSCYQWHRRNRCWDATVVNGGRWWFLVDEYYRDYVDGFVLKHDFYIGVLTFSYLMF